MNDSSLLADSRFSNTTRSDFLVPRTLSFKNGYPIVRSIRYPIALTNEEKKILDQFRPELIYGKVRQQPIKPFVPCAVLNDKKVLRFRGYFNSTVPDSIRTVVISYYLENDTMSIYEIPFENSSLVQGLRVRRHRILKNDQQNFYNWRDLNLGEILSIYGTSYRICDCDEFTRNWLEGEGIQLRCSQSIPIDFYSQNLSEKYQIEKQQRSGHSDLREIVADRRSYNRFDGKILRFKATLDDEQNGNRNQRQFLVYFYLIDRTVEIREIHRVNDGLEPSVIYLQRQKVAKDASFSIDSFVNLFISEAEKKKIRYVDLDDFRLGTHLKIFNRQFFLYDSDLCTKQYLSEHFKENIQEKCSNCE